MVDETLPGAGLRLERLRSLIPGCKWHDHAVRSDINIFL